MKTFLFLLIIIVVALAACQKEQVQQPQYHQPNYIRLVSGTDTSEVIRIN